MSEMLGREVDVSEYGMLDTFPVSAPTRITFHTEELQALCPAVEGIQPDIYDTKISYTAVTHAIESKSLKLWLVTYRNQRIFAEHLAVALYDKINELEGIDNVQINMEQNIRGGIITHIEYPYQGSSN